jgi:anti-anti-sigma factor
MEIVEHQAGSILVLELVGSLDGKSSPELQLKVGELIDQGNRNIVLDLVRADRLAGAGLRVLLMLTKKLESMNGHLILCSVSDEAKNAFEVAGFGRMLTMTATRDEALGSLAGNETVARLSDLALELLGKGADEDELPPS